MLVGPPVLDNMLNCPYLCHTVLKHRHKETRSVLLYLQTSFGVSVNDSSSLDGKRDRVEILQCLSSVSPSLLLFPLLCSETCLRDPSIFCKSSRGQVKQNLELGHPVLSLIALWQTNHRSGSETCSAGFQCYHLPFLRLRYWVGITGKTWHKLVSHGPSVRPSFSCLHLWVHETHGDSPFLLSEALWWDWNKSYV